MKYLNPVDETARALGFLTRLPIPNRFFETSAPDQTNQCAGFYPVAGLIIGLFGAIVLAVSHMLGHAPFIVATLAIFTCIILTGALHEDGLGDVADGFGGGTTLEKRLEIMKDSRLGTYGVLAVAGSLALKVGCLTAILQTSGAVAGSLALLASASLSRGAMVWFWASLPAAKTSGVSSTVGQPPDNAVSLAAILGLASGIVLGLAATGFIATCVAVLLSLGALLGFQRLCVRMIGGQTGDTLG
ncbi:MAG: adenosylcobinamide-GDP ribazoletransferase, partial [Ahrensia sp.]|nr:adenosylcobinamide-GDP ribazoletransferase [Ahrensia sp.]